MMLNDQSICGVTRVPRTFSLYRSVGIWGRRDPGAMFLVRLHVTRGLASALVLLTLGWGNSVQAEPGQAELGSGDVFIQMIEPVLQARCVSCHGADKQEGGLRLDSLDFALQGGDSGPAIVPGNAAQSRLVNAIRFEDANLQMPPKDRLSDKQIEGLTRWVNDGAVWPRPVKVLFDDEERFLAALTRGEAKSRLEQQDTHSGSLAVAVSPREKYAEQIADWKLAIRERPRPGEYRYLRYAWKKVGGGGAMLEVAREGAWPPAKASPAPGGRYLAGPNETGLDAIPVAESAPVEWTVVTIDLWKDLGDCLVTGLSLMASGGGETLFDAILLGSSHADLDAWSPGRGEFTFRPAPSAEVTGTAFEDARNPIRQLFHGERLDLWSLQPVKVEGGVSAPDDSTPGRGTGFVDQSPDMIDQFVEQRLTAAGLDPSAPADRRTLVRRVTFDLTGLPPGPAEVNAFVDDASPNAYVNLVERLLASPAYGERQARLWLDVVRYADTNGYERDEFRPLIWMYRDYVVRSFNADKAFDQFIREQLAGDELAAGPPRTPAEVDALMATGYLRLGQWDSTASIFQEEDRLRDEVMADLTNTTASAFLGLTMSCCQCHDHKYDPLSQADHYRLRAFFAGVIPRDELIVELPDKLQEIEQHNAQLNQQIEPLRAEQAQLNKEQEPGKTRHEELARQIAALESQLMRPLFAMGATEAGASAPATYVLYQGVYRDPRDEVLPGFPSVLYPGPALIEPTQNGTSGRRLALANWIASSNNPWTARVIVNRIWQQHFGAGLVASPNDFGVTGERPTHPELLDWLAATFVDDGWSIKRLHRAIVLSRAYQRASLQAGPAVQIDPENHLLWRQNVQRLDAETLRDSLLAVSGLLKPSSGGKPRWPEVPDELLHAQPAILEAIEGKDGGRRQGWYTDPLEETDVSSLYLVRKRCLPIPLLQVFDLPDTTVSCARRETTVVAPQALMLLNSPSALRYAEAFANRVWLLGDRPGEPDRPEPDLARLVKIAFRLGLARDPDSEELALAQDFLQQHAEQHRAAGRDPEVDRLALVDLCRAIFNLNEFCYVD